MAKTEEKLYGGWEYVCKSCQLIYHVYGSRLRCDQCNHNLKLVPPEKVIELLKEWGN